jgi:LysR family transcriptional regulator, nitrogen assimilation regulatory protein
LNFRHLRYFVEIVERGSMTRAAETLFVAQPALSQHIGNLERELGVKLLTRSVKGVTPTDAGEELLRRARAILAQVAETREAIIGGTTAPQGKVVLGLPPSVSAILGVPVIVRLQREYPKVALRIVDSTSGYVLEWLTSGRIDLGVVYGIQRAAGIDAEKLFQEQLYLIRAPAGPSAETEIKFRELEKLELVLPGRHHGLRDMLDRIAREHAVCLSTTVEIDALTQMKELVKLGVGYTVLSHAAVYDEIQRGELEAVRIIAPEVTRTMYIARPRDAPMSNAIRVTVETIKSCVDEMADRHLQGIR